MQYNSWLYLFPFLGGSLILYYLLPIKRRWIGLLFFEPAVLYSYNEKSGCRCPVYNGSHLSWCKSYRAVQRNI